MQWSLIFNINKKCTHEKVPLDADIFYCPDCGELVKNQWYLVRCACCGMKEIATVKNDEIMPLESCCHNCGSKNYTVEKIDKIDCININYAILLKEIVENDVSEYSQSWVETTQTYNDIQKLLQ